MRGFAGVRLTRPQVIQGALDLIDVEDRVHAEDEKTVLLLLAVLGFGRSCQRESRRDLGSPLTLGDIGGRLITRPSN